MSTKKDNKATWSKKYKGGSAVKNPFAMQEMQVQPLGGWDPLEKEMITHSGILAWENPMDRGAGQAQSMGSQRVGHDWMTEQTIYEEEGNGKACLI